MKKIKNLETFYIFFLKLNLTFSTAVLTLQYVTYHSFKKHFIKLFLNSWYFI